MKDDVRDLLEKEGYELGYRYVARKLGRGHHQVLDVMRELKREKNLLHPADAEELGYEIPIFEEDENGDRPTPVEPIPACRIHVEKPVASHTFSPLCRAEIDQPDRILLIPDTHSPHYDRVAWGAMVRFARSWRPHTIIHVGDLADCYSVSDHDKDPRRAHNLLEECKVTNGLLDELDSLGAVRKIICLGNHEFRLERHLMRNSPALLGAVSIEGLLNLNQRGWHVVPYMQHARIGNLHATHDVGRCGASAVRQTAVAVGHNVVIGHTHRLALEYFGTVLDERYVSASLGWLGDKSEATYKSEIEKAPWQHGFGTALMEPNGDFELQLRPIIAGRVISQ